MNIASTLDSIHAPFKQNKWMRYFTVFCRIALAAGFLPSGYVKIAGERFTDLHNNQPMGHYLEALFHTGYYYTTIGILQMTAAILLLIPRTALLGVLIYFPIIFNIMILSYSVRFEGSLHSSPLMVLACLYLICWDYDRLKYILPFNYTPREKASDKKFPFLFFGYVLSVIVVLFLVLANLYDIMPRNTPEDCQSQCKSSSKAEACYNFCDCIHTNGQPIGRCLDMFNTAEADIIRKP